MHKKTQVEFPYLCSELPPSQPLIDCPGTVSQNGLHSDKTSACCLHSCQTHCTVFGNLLKTLLNLTCGSFWSSSNENPSKVWCAQIGFCFFTGSSNGNTQMTSRNQWLKLTSTPSNCPLASLQMKSWIVTINNIYTSKCHLNDVMAIKRTRFSNSTKPGLSISHSSSG